jgi:hypothetical protein
MVKILVRIMVILLIAGLISGALYLLVADSTSGQGVLAGFSGRGGRSDSGLVAGLGNFDRPGSVLSIFSGGVRGRDFREDGAAQTLALTDIMVKLGLIGLMTLLVVWLQRGIGRFIKNRKAAKAAGSSS